MSALNSRLPGPMIALAYLAGGLALSVSYAQLRQVLQMQGGLPSGEYIGAVLPAAILFGGCVLWRMLGHLGNRQARAKTFGFAIAFVFFGAVFNESISVFTSAMSLTMGINSKVAQDIKTSDQYQAGQALTGATSTAAQRLADNLNSMPSNYFSKGNETAAQLQSLIDSQTRLTEASNATSNSVTQKTLDEFGASFGVTGDKLKTRWSWLLAMSLSIIPMALQVGLGTLSDGTLSEKQGRREADITSTAPELPTAKKSAGLSLVRQS